MARGSSASSSSSSSSPPSSTIINHFSHPHPLQLLDYQAHQTLTLPPCLACKLRASEHMYACLTCNYFLHQKCSQMPEKITHQSHIHQLILTFSPHYQNLGFSCDICKSTGSNHWHYRCNSCDFDAHLNCATTTPAVPAPQGEAALSSPMQIFMNSYHNSMNANLAAINAMASTSRRENLLANQRLQQMGSNVSADQMFLQRLMAGGLGGGLGSEQYLQSFMGGGGGGGAQLHGLMGGGGGLNPFQAHMGGGGGDGYANAMQILMGGGGGGGVNLQALMGGGNGGGVNLQELMGGGNGGADLMQSLMGGGGGGAADLLQGFLGALGGLG